MEQKSNREKGEEMGGGGGGGEGGGGGLLTPSAFSSVTISVHFLGRRSWLLTEAWSSSPYIIVSAFWVFSQPAMTRCQATTECGISSLH